MGPQICKRTIALIILVLIITVSPNLFGQSNHTYDNVSIDSLDADSWSGIVFLPEAFHQKVPFGVRIGSQSNDTYVDGEDIYARVREVGPHAPDASYCRMSWKPSGSDTLITLEWSRVDSTTVIGRITAPSNFQFVLETYFPAYYVQSGGRVSWDPDHDAQGFYSIDDSHQSILGERYFNNVFDATARLLVTVDRPTIGSGTYPALADLRNTMKGSGRLISSIASEPAVSTAGLEFATKDSTAHFVANLGWDKKRVESTGEQSARARQDRWRPRGEVRCLCSAATQREGFVRRRSGSDWEFDVLEYALRAVERFDFPQHQPQLGHGLGRLGGRRMGLFLRSVADESRR